MSVSGGISLIIGLGNPGAEYATSRHNLGYLTIDALLPLLGAGVSSAAAPVPSAAVPSGSSPSSRQASPPQKESGSFLSSLFSRQKVPYTKLRCEAIVSELDYRGRRIVLAKPQTYMNRSGRSLKGLLKHYGLTIDETLVVHDDLDVPQGVLRVKVGGGHGGHNGLRSLIDDCGADFARVKIGTGRPPGQMPADRYVLQQLHGKAFEELKTDANRAAEVVLTILRDGILAAQNTFNCQN